MGQGIGAVTAPLGSEQWQRDLWFRGANIPPKPLTFDPAFPPAVVQWLKAFTTGELADPGQGLALTGEPGTGKTTLAAHIAAYAVRKGKRAALGWDAETNVYPITPVIFTAYYDFVRDQKHLWKMEKAGLDSNDSYFEVESRTIAVNLDYPEPRYWAKLAVLDDVGKEYRSGSGWAETELNGLLRLRHRYGCPTIITSNYALAEWSDVYGPALGSFAREAFIEVPIKGEDRR